MASRQQKAAAPAIRKPAANKKEPIIVHSAHCYCENRIHEETTFFVRCKLCTKKVKDAIAAQKKSKRALSVVCECGFPKATGELFCIRSTSASYVVVPPGTGVLDNCPGFNAICNGAGLGCGLLKPKLRRTAIRTLRGSPLRLTCKPV